MTIKYFVKKTKKQPVPIFFRIIHGKIDLDLTLSSGFVVNFENWNPKRQEIKLKVSSENIDFINSQLRGFKEFMTTQFNLYVNTNNIFNDVWLQQKHSEFFNKTIKKNELYFLDWVNNFIADCPNRFFSGKKITDSRLQRFKIVSNKIKSYETYSKKRLEFKNIDLDFHKNFVFYCQKIELLSNNSILTYIKHSSIFVSKLRTKICQ